MSPIHWSSNARTVGHGRYQEVRTRARDDPGRSQPDTVPWNDKGCCYNAYAALGSEVVGVKAQVSHTHDGGIGIAPARARVNALVRA